MTQTAEIWDIQKGAQEDAHGFDADPVNILVVDDIPGKLLSYEAILEELGQNIVTARSGEEALKLVLRQEFAVILLDVNMPGMDGFETATLIRQRRKSAHTPIIFLTAFNDEMRMAQGYASGAVDYLPTPVVPEILQAKVKVFIELSRMRRQAALQAEEHARRKAAEESARRLEFLVTVSEVFARTQGQSSIMQALIRLPVPYLADTSGIWVLDAETRDLKPLCVNIKGVLLNDMAALPLPAALENAMRQVLASGHPQHLSRLSLPALLDAPKQDAERTSSGTALIVPLVVRDKLSAVFVLAFHAHHNFDPAAHLSLASDLTSRASIALENSFLLEKIKETDQRKDEFLAMLAHELRNPLAPIRNSLNVLKLTDDEKLRAKAQDTIDKQINHMVHLVDDLMDVSRITQGKIDLRKERVQLKDMINHAIDTSLPLIQQRGHDLRVEIPETPLWLNGDFGRLSQIFSNLLNNAAKYTDFNGAITLSVTRWDGKVRIAVRDNGIGIPAHMLSHIFEIFAQVDSSLERSQGGLGIGLTLVKKLVELHGGTISVASDGSNKGSEFAVFLPLLAAQTVFLPAPETAAHDQAQEMHTPIRILVVDDNMASAQTIGWMIEFFGHEVYIAHDGAAAMELAEKHRPGVVLLDIGLPGMNGYDICGILKQKPGLEHTVFIAQTGWGQPEHRRRSQEAGFDHHLIKPVDMEALKTIIHDSVRKISSRENAPEMVA